MDGLPLILFHFHVIDRHKCQHENKLRLQRRHHNTTYYINVTLLQSPNTYYFLMCNKYSEFHRGRYFCPSSQHQLKIENKYNAMRCKLISFFLYMQCSYKLIVVKQRFALMKAVKELYYCYWLDKYKPVIFFFFLKFNAAMTTCDTLIHATSL